MEKHRDIRLVKMSDIVADEKFNVRQSYPEGEIKGLASQIKAQGLLNPLLVREMPDGKLYLLAGFRRYKAIQALDWSAVSVQIFQGEPIEEYIVNISENLTRKDLQGYELAERCEMMSRTFKIDGGEIAKRLGVSKGHANNLIRIVERLKDTRYYQAWKSNDSPATMQHMIKLAALEDDEERSRYWATQVMDKDKGKREKGENGEAKIKRPSPAALEALEVAIRTVRRDGGKKEEWCQGALAVVQWALGKRRTPPVEVAEEGETKAKKGRAKKSKGNQAEAN